MDVGQDRRRQFASHSSARLTSGRWPVRAQRLIEASYTLSVEGLHEPVKHCLGEFEKKLFALAERAPRADEQQDLFASRQRTLQQGGAVQQRFLEHLGKAINELDRADTLASSDAADAKPWQSLELLDPAVQELSMTLEQIGARGEVRHGSQLHELGYRLAVLIGSPPLEGKSLPLGPHALASAFNKAAAELALPLKHQLLLLQQFDQWVIASLASLYSTINAQFQTDGILPQLRSIPLPRQVSKRPRANAADTAPAPAEPSPTEDRQGKSSAPASGGDSIEVLESLRDLLAQRRASQGTATGPSGARAASEDELQTALSALQQHLAQVTDHASRELRSAARLREELLAQLNLGKPADAPQTQLSDEQGDTVELVAGLFEQLGQQLQHGGDARGLLSNMQLPVLRMAVADPGFFEKREHPARRLLDTVTSAANDWLDGSDDESNRPLTTKLEQLVNRANQEPPSTGLYATLLADIEHHLALLTRKAQAAERRHVEAAQGRERLDQARRRAGELMAERFAQSPPRGLLRALLDRAWSDVLALTLLRHGEESDTFKGQLEITDQLLGRLPTPDRMQLQQDVESGLQQIGMHVEESVQVAQRLIGAGKPDPSIDLPSATDLALRLKQHQRLGEHQSEQDHAGAGPVSTPPSEPPPIKDPRAQHIEQHLKKLPFGTWFEFVDPASGQIMQRKLAWHSPMSGRCLLVSRRGQRGEEMTLAQLAQEVASGRACEVPTQREGLLDRAWRNLTGSLRQGIGARRASSQESSHR
ncbi:MAG: DUF1631 family protein [Rhodanobacter sp.]|jgi:hypothetical protein